MHACMHASRRPTLASSALPPTRSRRHRQYARRHRTPSARVEQRCYFLDTDLPRPNRYRSCRYTTLDTYSDTAQSSIIAYACTAYAVAIRHTTAAGSSPTAVVFAHTFTYNTMNLLSPRTSYSWTCSTFGLRDPNVDALSLTSLTLRARPASRHRWHRFIEFKQ